MSAKPGSRNRVVTLIIHGTFAADQGWWRLGDGSAPTFASRLEAALGEQGIEGTVWRPAIESGMGYEDFTWSGRNYHRARVAGARKLAASIENLAERMGCSRDAPLTVNLVAHSHGGNVVLEILNRFPRAARVGRVVFLGTPLISQRPAFRPVRVLIASLLLLVVGVLLLGAVVNLVNPDAVPDFGRLDLALWTLIGIVGYGWLFWVVAELFDLFVAIALKPIWIASGRGAGQVYGPSPPRLLRRLGGGKIVLFTSHQDEADLALQLGAAPRQLYIEEVRARYKLVGRVLELVFVRPFVDGVGLKLLEALLERFVLGFSWLGVTFRDFQMVDIDKSRAYPPSVIRRLDVTDELLPALRAKFAAAARPLILGPIEDEADADVDRRTASFRDTLQAVGRDIAAQVRLRHSVYYESDAVIARIAEALAA